MVNKNDINQTDILISFGIGDEWSFENYFNCQIYAYDGQIAPLKNFDSLNRTFINKNVGKENKNTQVSISSILDKKFNVFLKCDIDGGEYQILDELIEYAQIFTGIVIEFHTISKNSNFNHIVNFISKIGMKLVHTHIRSEEHTSELQSH